MSFISYETSQNMLDLLEVPKNRFEKVALSCALGRVLAEDIVAKYSDPQFPTASMDGYGVRYEDLELGRLRVVGHTPAGTLQEHHLTKGEAIKTFTGSQMPQGADTLIPIENVILKDDGMIEIVEMVPKGFSVRPVAEGYKAGDVLIKKGTKIGFAEIGVMAGLNCVMVKVARKPRVGVLATGSEILDLGEEAQNTTQIRSSNNYTLAALFEQAGAEVVQLATAPDDKEQLMQIMHNALESVDILVTTGGVSVGDYDFVKDIVPRLGAQVVFKGVAIKPGRHIMVAQKGLHTIVSLPGFAYSSTVTGILYVLPLIAKMLAKESAYSIVPAVLEEDFKKRSPFTEFTACNVTLCEDGYKVNFSGKKVGSSAILINMLNNSGLMIADKEDTFLQKGTLVHVITMENN